MSKTPAVADAGDLLCLIVGKPNLLEELRDESLLITLVGYFLKLLPNRLQLDLNPIAWTSSATTSDNGDSLSLELALDHIMIFCNAHLALRHENELAIFAAGLGSSRLLYSSQMERLSQSHQLNRLRDVDSFALRDNNTYQKFRAVDEMIAEGVKKAMEGLPDSLGQGSIGLVGAFAMALCHINRLNSSESGSNSLDKPKPRIAILSVTEDPSFQYVPIMNCIFSAQKAGIPIDVCKVYGPDAVFLQQACHLTSGSYCKIARREGLLQYLFMTFLPGPMARKHIYQSSQPLVDLRAACFCHRKIVDIGYVCSVCLSIFCTALPVCPTCRTKFPLATLKRLGQGSKIVGCNAAVQHRTESSKKRNAVLPKSNGA